MITLWFCLHLWKGREALSLEKHLYFLLMFKLQSLSALRHCQHYVCDTKSRGIMLTIIVAKTIDLVNTRWENSTNTPSRMDATAFLRTWGWCWIPTSWKQPNLHFLQRCHSHQDVPCNPKSENNPHWLFPPWHCTKKVNWWMSSGQSKGKEASTGTQKMSFGLWLQPWKPFPCIVSKTKSRRRCDAFH